MSKENSIPVLVLTYESFSSQIDEAIEKRRHKWRYPHIDFDDLAQGIRLRILTKWGKWDQKRSFTPWVNALITNYLINIAKETYTNYSPPCSKCVGDEGGDLCRFTESRRKCSQCELYRNWEKSKKAAFNVKIPLSAENHAWEIGNIQQDFFSVDCSRKALIEEMKNHLNPLEYRVFDLMFVQNLDESKVAVLMNFKTSEEGRKPGYRQLKNYKDLFLKKAKEILATKDILQ